MAGARAVEEVLARGGADRFEITMFGDEPYGNYNRILLSNVVSGNQDTSEIYLNRCRLVRGQQRSSCTPVPVSPDRPCLTYGGSGEWGSRHLR